MLREGRRNAAANVEDVEEREYPLEFVGDNPVDGREDCACLELWRLSCRALARAFSWVRTKLARFCHETRKSDSIANGI